MRFGLTLPCEGDKKVGHAWICDGLRECKYYTDYKLFALDNEAYPGYSKVCIEYVREQDYGYNLCSYHMNWGWGGTHDGWFYEARWKPTDNRISTHISLITKPLSRFFLR